MKLSKEVQEKINELQLLEQNSQSFMLQKQNFQVQLMEVESALKELEKTKEAYKIVGNIMVSSSKSDLKKDLESKKEMLELRVKSLEKQEEKLKEKSSKLQEEVMLEMKEKE
jgi:prefoldin beta subunit